MNVDDLKNLVMQGKDPHLEFKPSTCELRMVRFGGMDKTVFLDQRQICSRSFRLLEEAEILCQRHRPLPAKIAHGQMRRVETALIPPDGMREILVDAWIYRNYSILRGAISMATFDDRDEVWSTGNFPRGITPEMPTRKHASFQRNPIIADVFHRKWPIEKWGCRTNRVAEMCVAAGIGAPHFEEIRSVALGTFKVQSGSTAAPREGAHKTPPNATLETAQARQGTPQVSLQTAAVLEAAHRRCSSEELQRDSYRKDGVRFLKAYLEPLLVKGWLERTIPDKPPKSFSELQNNRGRTESARKGQVTSRNASKYL
jgi:predicted HTH transcriptional regulator